MKNLVVTLDINYPKEITQLTFPYMQKYAKNIDADFKVISERKFSDLPIPMEKFQLYDLCGDYDWTIFLDADCLINPDTVNFTKLVEKKTFIIGEDIDLEYSQFIQRNILNHYNLYVHIPGYFFAFHKMYKKVFKLPKKPLYYVKYIKNAYNLSIDQFDSSWHLDEFLISLNASRFVQSTFSIKDNLKNYVVIAHLPKLSISTPNLKMITLDEKIAFLKQNIELIIKK